MKKNLKIMVCGNFNVIHSGHIRILEFAKKLGKKLIVGVYSDQLAGRAALINEKKRLKGIKSLNIVNEAHIVENKKKYILSHKPNILVKGKEHENKQNPEEIILKSYNGSLIFGSGQLGISSEDFINEEISNNQNNNYDIPYGYINRHKISFEGLNKILQKFNKLKVLVIGDIIIDKYIFLDALGMSREDPTIVTKKINENFFLGGAGIVALHASALGADVKLVSAADKNKYRNFVEKNLTKNNVKYKLFTDSGNRTVVKEKFRTIEKTLLRINNFNNNYLDKKITQKIITYLKKEIQKRDAIIISDFNYGLINTEILDSILKYCKKFKKKIFADCQSSSQFGDLLRYKNVELITPTEYEARINMKDFESGLVVLSKKLKNSVKAKNVLLTLAKEGVLIQSSKKNKELETDRIASLNKKPKDVSGAGDSMFITSSLAISAGSNIWNSALLGSFVAALQVSRFGNIPVKKKELENILYKIK
jgi:rfaE bifunctional protein kinase chain/domain